MPPVSLHLLHLAPARRDHGTENWCQCLKVAHDMRLPQFGRRDARHGLVEVPRQIVGICRLRILTAAARAVHVYSEHFFVFVYLRRHAVEVV